MKKGRQLLIANEKINEPEISHIESRLAFKFPDYYKEFMRKYKQGEEGLNMERVFREDIQYFDIAGPVIYTGGLKREIIIDHFFDYEELVRTWNSIDKFESTGERKMIKIAALGSDPNGGLYLGVGENNRDQIWRVNWEMDNEDMFEKVADSIWSFIDGLSQGK